VKIASVATRMPWVGGLSLRCPRRAPVVVVTRSGESDSVVVRTPSGINRHMELKRTVELTPSVEPAALPVLVAVQMVPT